MRQHMMNEIAVQTAIAIFKGMNIDEAESKYGRGYDRIEFSGRTAIEIDEPLHEGGKIARLCIDMVGQRHATGAIMFSDKAVLGSQAEVRQSVVPDDDALQPEKFFQIKRCLAGLADDTAPPLNTILRRSLSLDSIA